MYEDSTAMEMQPKDVLALLVFVPAAAINLGYAKTIGGLDLGRSLWDLGAGHSISIASIAAILALSYVAYTNDWSLDWSLKSFQAWLVVTTFGLVITPPFFPILQDTLIGTGAGLIALTIQVMGFLFLAWLG